MSSFNFPFLFLYFLAELRIDQLQVQKGSSQIANLEPLVHLWYLFEFKLLQTINENLYQSSL